MTSDTDDTNSSTLKGPLILSGIVLSLPPVLAILSAIWPGLIPVPFSVEDDPSGIQPFMLLIALGLLIFNAGFLYLLHRMMSD